MKGFCAFVTVVALMATPALGAVYTGMDIDETQSQLSLTIGIYLTDPNTNNPAFTGTDSSVVDGSLSLEVLPSSPGATTGQARITGMNVALVDDLEYSLFFGLISATAEDIEIELTSPLPGLVSYDLANDPDFIQSGVWLQLAGTVAYDIDALGIVEEGEEDLGELDPLEIPTPPGIAASFTEGSGLSIPLDVEQIIPVELGEESTLYIGVQLEGTIVAVPEPVSLSLLALGGVGVLLRRRR